MRTWKKYTKEEDKIIFDTISENSHNIKKCFMTLSAQLKRTEAGIQYRWYAELSNPESKNYMGTASITINKRAVSNNRKLDYKGMKTHPEKIKVSIFRRIVNQVKDFFKR